MAPFRIVLILALIALLSACTGTHPRDYQAPMVVTCENQTPQNCAGNDFPEVEIQFDIYGNINGVDDPAVRVCRNGKVTFRSNNSNFTDYGILISRDTDKKIDKAGYWSNLNTGITEVKIKNKEGCVGYTVIRKLDDGSGAIKYLDPIFIIDK